MKHIVDIICEVVDSCKTSGLVVTLTDNGDNTYSIVTPSTTGIDVGRYISFLNTTNFTKSFYLVLSKTSNSFKISESKGVVITKLGVWVTLQPYFLFEKWLGAANEVSLNHIVSNYTKQNYPLVFLLLDITENRGDNVSIFSEVRIKVFFINQTVIDVDANYRLQNNFKTILIPLYEKFVAGLNNNYYVFNNQLIKHTYTERFYLGSAGVNQNALNDAVDAIETEFNIKIKNVTNC